MKSLFEEMDGTYRQEGDYFLPNLSLPSDPEEYQIGKYGRMRLRFLKEHRRALYTSLVLKGRDVAELLGEEEPRSLMERLRRKEHEKERAQRDQQPQRKKQKDRGWER